MLSPNAEEKSGYISCLGYQNLNSELVISLSNLDSLHNIDQNEESVTDVRHFMQNFISLSKYQNYVLCFTF